MPPASHACRRSVCKELAGADFSALRRPTPPVMIRTRGRLVYGKVGRTSLGMPRRIEMRPDKRWGLLVVRVALLARHQRLRAPRDFDVTTRVAVIRPTLEAGSDPHAPNWRPDGEPPCT